MDNAEPICHDFLGFRHGNGNPMTALPDDTRSRLLALELVGFTAQPATAEPMQSDSSTCKVVRAGLSKSGIGKVGMSKPPAVEF